MWNTLKTTALFASLTLLLVAVGAGVAGDGGAAVALAVSLALNLGAWWFSDRIALRSCGAVALAPGEAPALRAAVERLARRLELPVPRLYRIPLAAPNAFATGRSPRHAAVAVTDGLLRRLPPDELEAVLAHELGHVLNRDTLLASVVAAFAGAIALLARWFGWSLVAGAVRDRRSGGLERLALLLLAPLAAMWIQLAIGRSREFHADALSVVSCAQTDSLLVAARLMWAHDVGAVPVVDGKGKVEGIVTDRDVAMAAMLEGRRLTDLRVSDTMTRHVVTCSPGEDVEDAAERMADRQVRRIPVVDAHDHLVGLLTLNDLASAAGSRRGSGVPAARVASTLQAICRRRESAEARAK